MLSSCLALVLATAWTPEPAPLPPDPWESATASAAEGAQIFESCASCHLADASGRSDGTIPRLAGQSEAVLVSKLDNLASGHVALPVMAPFARALSGEERRAVAAWLASLPPTGKTGVGSRDRTAEGSALFAATCAACHAIDGSGMPALGAPAICGQHEAYILRRVEEIADGERGDADPAMAAVLSSMSASDVAAVADFLARTPCTEVDGG